MSQEIVNNLISSMPETESIVNMPKTKRLKKAENDENVKPNKKVLDKTIIDSFLKDIDDEMVLRNIMIEAKSESLMLQINNFTQEQFFKLRAYNHITMGELKNMKVGESATTINSTIFKEAPFNSTRSVRRSRSMSSKGIRNRSTSRAPTTKTKITRVSRSLSRNKIKPYMKNNLNSYTTPMNQNMSNNMFGLITPKIKPNTPQVVLRRPKLGEIAVSMQGSPLMVGNVTSDEKPNINIPLEDGRIFSIQAERGLRRSQVPDLNPEIRRHMETLRDNLDKFCQYAK